MSLEAKMDINSLGSISLYQVFLCSRTVGALSPCSTLQPEILSHNSGILALGSRWRRILMLGRKVKQK